MDIKIVICLILLCLIPLASATDTLWTAKSSGFINFNGSISHENYLVKAIVLDDTTSLISVYRNNVLVEARNFRINENKNYDNISLTLLGIKGGNSWVSISKLEQKEFWRFLKSAQLKWGESYSVENYSFIIDTYGRDSVNLTISNNTGTEKKEFITGGEKVFHNFRMKLTNIDRTGFIYLDFFTNKLPDYKTEVFPFVKAQIFTDKDEYFPDETIKVSITVTSDFTLNLIGITLETNPNAEVSQDNFSITDFSGEKTFETIITRQPLNSTLSIKAKLNVLDFFGNSYVLDAGKDISITPEIALIKRVPTDTDDETVPVQLYIYNSGLINRSVSVRDMIPEELAAKSLEWELDIGPKNSRILEYNVTPLGPGLYILPSATGKWDGGTTTSKKVKITMHMPYLTMAKSIEHIEGKTLVKVVTTNIGDRPSQVNIWDNIPSGNNVLSGETTLSGKLEKGEKVEISYYLQGDVETHPAAQASYMDIRGVTRQARSNIVEFGKIVERTQQEKAESTKPLNVAPSDLVLFMISSFIAIAGIVSGAALVAYLVARMLR